MPFTVYSKWDYFLEAIIGDIKRVGICTEPIQQIYQMEGIAITLTTNYLFNTIQDIHKLNE